MSKRLIIHAPNINSGGGYTLFKALINSLKENSLLIIDKRLPISDSEITHFDFIRVNPTVFGRLRAEIMLYKLSNTDDIVVCFGNLPPLVRLKAKTILFIQNRYLLEHSSIVGMPYRLKLRVFIEHYWVKFFHYNADEIIVQTLTMKKLVLKFFSRNSLVLPFIQGEIAKNIKKERDIDKVYDFIYVASGEIHKNHYQLIDAWIELAKLGYFPTLCVTISPNVYSSLCVYLQKSIFQYQLKIVNLGDVSHPRVMQLYQQSYALIYPSKMESFGLPLLEANSFGLKIIASELDYVRDVVNPDETFDPNSSISIMRSVVRFMGYENIKTRLLDAKKFLDEIVNL